VHDLVWDITPRQEPFDLLPWEPDGLSQVRVIQPAAAEEDSRPDEGDLARPANQLPSPEAPGFPAIPVPAAAPAESMPEPARRPGEIARQMESPDLPIYAARDYQRMIDVYREVYYRDGPSLIRREFPVDIQALAD